MQHVVPALERHSNEVLFLDFHLSNLRFLSFLLFQENEVLNLIMRMNLHPVKLRKGLKTKLLLKLIQFSNVPQIPVEILTYIFQYLEAKELAHLRLVCRNWKDIILEIPVKIHITHKERTFSGISSSFKKIVDVHIQLHGKKIMKLLSEFISKCNTLTKFTCLGKHPGLFSMFPQPKLLRHLTMIICAPDSILPFTNVEYLQ
jgi:hypothetical protein